MLTNWQKVEHAGYKRTVIRRNLPKYDYDGDEVLDYEDEDSLDASPVEEDPYKDIKLDRKIEVKGLDMKIIEYLMRYQNCWHL